MPTDRIRLQQQEDQMSLRPQDNRKHGASPEAATDSLKQQQSDGKSLGSQGSHQHFPNLAQDSRPPRYDQRRTKTLKQSREGGQKVVEDTTSAVSEKMNASLSSPDEGHFWATQNSAQQATTLPHSKSTRRASSKNDDGCRKSGKVKKIQPEVLLDEELGGVKEYKDDDMREIQLPPGILKQQDPINEEDHRIITQHPGAIAVDGPVPRRIAGRENSGRAEPHTLVTDDQILLQATAVQDEDSGRQVPSVLAVPAPDEVKGVRALVRNKWFWPIVVLAVLGLGAAIVMGVLLTRNDKNEQGDNTDDKTLTDAATIELIYNNSFRGGVAFDDPASPQSKALAWLQTNSGKHNFSDNQKLQRFALATFFFSTNGTEWLANFEWLSDSHECNWYISPCVFECSPFCRDGRHVSNLYLKKENLTGTLPPELALLSNSLEIIQLENNALSGSIPTEFGLLTQLQSISMDLNRLTSSIPTEFGLLTNLNETIDLDDNNLTGSIPTEIGLLVGLEWIALRNNSIVSSIPTEIGLLTGLASFDVEENLITGTIPTEIGSLKNLGLGLSLFENRLTGTIPTEIGTLTSLRSLNLRDNLLTGTVPVEIELMTSLRYLYLYGNNFSSPFTCPSFITFCRVSCDDWNNASCRQL